uniref:Uncharacterized protein n=1 Tax=Lepeophtheirus salmonis TaxID=72036 RepID=A0A0K2SY34_LEPSM
MNYRNNIKNVYKKNNTFSIHSIYVIPL